MYQPYPGNANSPEPSVPAAPRSVMLAVRTMYVGAAASLIGIAIALTGAGAMRAQIARTAPKLTPAQVTSATHVEIALLIGSGLIEVGLWIWMARSCQAGRSWARVVATVLFALDTIAALVGAVAGTLAGVSRVYGVLVWLIGLVAVVLLWRRSSSGYFAGVSARR